MDNHYGQVITSRESRVPKLGEVDRLPNIATGPETDPESMIPFILTKHTGKVENS